jgi:hypothetical protein
MQGSSNREVLTAVGLSRGQKVKRAGTHNKRGARKSRPRNCACLHRQSTAATILFVSLRFVYTHPAALPLRRSESRLLLVGCVFLLLLLEFWFVCSGCVISLSIIERQEPTESPLGLLPNFYTLGACRYLLHCNCCTAILSLLCRHSSFLLASSCAFGQR